MTGPIPDLAALREARAWIDGISDPLWPGLTESDWAQLMGRVLALVDRLQDENERLRLALAGSPAEKETNDA